MQRSTILCLCVKPFIGSNLQCRQCFTAYGTGGAQNYTAVKLRAFDCTSAQEPSLISSHTLVE